MALMSWREGDRVKRVGIRPAHDGEQVVKSASGIGGTIVLYTVPAGKTLFITSVWLSNGSSSSSEVDIRVRDASAVIQYSLLRLIKDAADSAFGVSRDLFFPIEVPAAYDIEIYFSSSTSRMQGGFSGWVE